MKEEGSKTLPLARRARIIVKKLRDEVLVYDLDRDKAHCLNRPAAAQQICGERMCLSTPPELVLKAVRQSIRGVSPSLAT